MNLKQVKFYVTAGLVAAMLFVSLPARAFFHDTETSTINLWTAGVVDAGLSLGDWDDAAVAADLQISTTAVHELDIDTSMIAGNGSFSYRLFADSSDSLCGQIAMDAYQDGALVFSGSLASFDVTVAVTDTTDAWRFEYTPMSGEVSPAAACTYEYVVRAYELVLGYGNGFFDEDRVASQLVTTGFGTAPVDETNEEEGQTEEEEEGTDGDNTNGSSSSGIVLNEIAADATIGNVIPLQGKEWVEVANIGSTTIDIAGWQLSEVRGSSLAFYTVVDESDVGNNDEVYTLGNGTTVAPGEFVVLVFTAENRLNNNDGDTVTLYLPDGVTVIDQRTYAEAIDESSEGRLPDGTGDWVSTERTPGAANIEESDED